MIFCLPKCMTAVVSTTLRAKLRHARQASAFRSAGSAISPPSVAAIFSSIRVRYFHKQRNVMRATADRDFALTFSWPRRQLVNLCLGLLLRSTTFPFGQTAPDIIRVEG